MAPIPVHIDDPIAPTKAQGVTPQTSDQPATLLSHDATASLPIASSRYPPARPGAAAVPAPTPSIPNPQPAPTRTQPSLVPNEPPLPQPGAVPVPPGQQTSMNAANTSPPQPKPADLARQYAPHTNPANVMQILPPQQNYAPTHSTTTYMPPNIPQQQLQGPTTVNLGTVHQDLPRTSAEHPPGYHQNAYAQEMSSAQRLGLEEQQRRESLTSGLGLGGGGGGGGGSVDSMWDAVKGWANKAGQSLAETEENVWKRINGQQ